MFGIGEGELMIILVFGFLLFGPDKLPQMGRTIGRAMRQFRETQEKMTSVVQSEIIDPVTEAANAPIRPKKVEDDIDDDVDADVDDDATAEKPQKKETFAERRARLAAEKAAAEGDTEADADAGEDTAADDEAKDAAEPEAAEPEAEEPAVEPEPEEDPEAKALNDLYARRPRKRKAAVVDELKQELSDEEAPAEPTAAEAPATEGGDE